MAYCDRVTAEESSVAREPSRPGLILFGSLSELYGRKRPMLWDYVMFVIFQVPIGVAENVKAIIICRFLGGIAAPGPLPIAGGYLTGLFDPVSRSLALAYPQEQTIMGPIIGLIVG
ncbi:hypothetical protein BJX62DRAFT_234756 [Aspergillus germanicus]